MIIFYGLMKIKQIYLTCSTQLTYFFSYQYYFLRKKKIYIWPPGVAQEHT
jgi:hypothetical protein